MTLEQQETSNKRTTQVSEATRAKEERLNFIAKKVACTLVECNATYDDVNRVFSRVGRYLALNTTDALD